ncbi:DNA/RNA nuclease SfsA [Lapidilactobacillus gannanensis]|jgi:sugar fermentation stimulation protein A|uniref:Sugar fermentation stimulation protein homolog n=1 Tax=Lapidilactobacillus gannanensis TaxID=2486002 RepID=A0ABW4BNP2_9LACO|nr:DNA/RNA nuclease SfsA [Lapidilactobacillus gannanensis]MCH4057712.1 DNA/RNA nuclease SfsA [Lactobacillaceae bacterium]
MRYATIKLATFISRPNRFIAHCQLAGELVVVHVKNTGKCLELLIPGVLVALNYLPSPQRKTDYDLVAVKTVTRWINIDSQIPNALAAAALNQGQMTLPQLDAISLVKREVVFRDARFDIAGTTGHGRNFFVEVKGVTLVNGKVAAFPDAVTTRGLKHVETLIQAQRQGYQAYLLFIIQVPQIEVMTINRALQPELAAAIATAQANGVQVLAYNCQVSAAEITIDRAVRFDLQQPFELPPIPEP